ncbi:alpha/beta fold hydrolase [Longispora albida]|uniref:alpha/beta fold hydrolase n=1 Tax=Longispora albida TaxID=203523 RepID=UPI00036DA8E9|nr:alpha/beta hydrolase [Longispora albida]
MVSYGGSGAPIVLLHGMMGSARSWTGHEWLTDLGRVYALDSRGHGAAPRGPFGEETRVADVIQVLEKTGPSVLIGHSMGGMTAWQVAGARPDLVRGIVAGDMPVVIPERVSGYRAWFESWPAFADAGEVAAFFGREHAGMGRFFAEQMPDGKPPFAVADMLEIVATWENRDLRPQLAAVQCPALLVKGELSTTSRETLSEAAALLPLGSYAEVPGAGHVLHYDNPDGWRAIVEPFVRNLGT